MTISVLLFDNNAPPSLYLAFMENFIPLGEISLTIGAGGTINRANLSDNPQNNHSLAQA